MLPRLEWRNQGDFKEEVMKSVRPTPAWLACILLATLLLVTVGATANLGRPFTGYFEMSGVQEQGDMVQVTLHVKLFNHGDEDLKGVIVTLMDAHPTMMLRGNFQPVKVWKSQKFVSLSQEFTVTKREYADWTSAMGQPYLIILFQDSNGKSWQKSPLVSRSHLAQ
jgi:hypothetical protein